MIFNRHSTCDISRKDVDFVCDHDTGQLWILHGKPLLLQNNLFRAALDISSREMVFFSDDARTCRIPVAIQNPLLDTFLKGDSITLIWMDKGAILDCHVLPMGTISGTS